MPCPFLPVPARARLLRLADVSPKPML